MSEKEKELVIIKRTKLINEIINILLKKLYITERENNWVLREYIKQAIKTSEY